MTGPRASMRPKASRPKGQVTRSSPRTRSKHSTTMDINAEEAAIKVALHSLGLYADKMVGDGNCLFRSLGDQMYGTPRDHLTIRSNICDYMERYPELFQGFMEVPLDSYLANMRTPGTYGGNIELTAYSKMTSRTIKVIQPGYVFVICPEDESPAAKAQRQREREALSVDHPGPISRRDARKRRQAAPPPAATDVIVVEDDDETEDEADTSTLFIVYHQAIEHYDSVRNLQGPHKGIPRVRDWPVAPLLSSPSGALPASDGLTPPERLILDSLPDPSRYSLEEIRRLLTQFKGAWEDVLEHLIARDTSPAASSSASLNSSISTAATTTTSVPPVTRSPKRSPSPQSLLRLESPRQRPRFSGDVESNTSSSSSDGPATPSSEDSSAPPMSSPVEVIVTPSDPPVPVKRGRGRPRKYHYVDGRPIKSRPVKAIPVIIPPSPPDYRPSRLAKLSPTASKRELQETERKSKQEARLRKISRVAEEDRAPSPAVTSFKELHI